MGLEFDEPEHHLRPRPLQVTRPANIGFLVKARLELDEARHRLAGFGRQHQRLDDRAVGRGAVQRLLDRHHVGVARRLHQELRHHVKAFERMVDQDVLGADRGKAVAAIVANPFGEAGVIGRELEIRAVDVANLAGVGEPEEPMHLENLDFLDPELLGNLALERARHRAFDFQPDHLPAPTLAQRRFKLHHQIGGFVVDFDFAVADHPERARPDHFVPGEHLVEEQLHQRIDGDDLGASFLTPARWAGR